MDSFDDGGYQEQAVERSRSVGEAGVAFGHGLCRCGDIVAQAQGDLAFAERLFRAVGDTYDIPEPLFDTFTGMSASGLAYAAVFAEALADGGVRMGLPRATANELARKLLVSSGELLAQRAHPAILKDEVCSPGGTTIAGIRALEGGNFRRSVIDAVEAATRRGHELGEEPAD